MHTNKICLYIFCLFFVLIRPDILLQCVYESIYALVTPLEDISLNSSESINIIYYYTFKRGQKLFLLCIFFTTKYLQNS